MITIVDYGLGNIQAFYNIYKRLNLPVTIASTPDELLGSSKLILPGVGSFDWAMERLQRSGMRNMLDELVLDRQIPVLGVCVGMQMMAKSSEEGVSPGLAWLDAVVRRFDVSSHPQKTYLPHMGWNTISPACNSILLQGLTNPRFYFLHSYYIKPSLPTETLATTPYLFDFSSMVGQRHIYGVQFHPEKSHFSGTQLLSNFASI